MSFDLAPFLERRRRLMARTDANPPMPEFRDDYVLQEVDAAWLSKAVKPKQFIHIDQSECIMCEGCVDICPWKCIFMVRPDAIAEAIGTEQPGQDPRAVLAAWVTDPKNEYFAGAMVNRLWAHYFNVGLVEPIDDLRESNPPTNPDLWKSLVQEFVAKNYYNQHPRLLQFVLSKPPDRVKYTNLSLLKKDFDEIQKYGIEAGITYVYDPTGASVSLLEMSNAWRVLLRVPEGVEDEEALSADWFAPRLAPFFKSPCESNVTGPVTPCFRQQPK